MKDITYAHEHITIDLSGVKKETDCQLDDMNATVSELIELKQLGVNTIIDVTNRGMGRNVIYANEVARKTGLKICLSTGYYKDSFFPQEVYELSYQELARIMINEIIIGIDGSEFKAGVIGEIGTGSEFTPLEMKVFAAAGAAHYETGAPIITHTTLGQLGLKQVKVLQKAGVCLEKVSISHVDLSGDIDYIMRLIDSGVYVAFDTIGKLKYQADTLRAEMLKKLCERGLSERIMLSMDITRKSHLKAYGGLGYSYLLTHFVPLLLNYGVKEQDVENMLIYNPKQFYNIGK